MPDAMRACLVVWTPEQLATRADEAIDVLAEAMGCSPAMREGSRRQLIEDLTMPGFRAVATLGPLADIVGFGYGYLCRPGQWWRDWVAGAMPVVADRRQWLDDACTVSELQVRPACQGRGLGEAMLRGMLSSAGTRTAVLSTAETTEERSRAWRLYRRMGFRDLRRGLRYPGDPRAFAIFGRDLPRRDGSVGRTGDRGAWPALRR
ncbi:MULTISPECIES: GNAT family N-acetyltransferase [unclassified Micromonospora]|uniref:GNAT family N-acetyltransferase n=1 Tax=unclassified Micromonospora TaxID=2617518 RepID=UPI0029F5BC29|nr:GNAT family N-acetyltransferase [Micromonospora sp. DR5-3]